MRGPFAKVDDRGDGAVGEVVHFLVHVSEDGDAEGDVLDDPGYLVDADDVTDAILVFERDADARNEIAHEVLATNAECDPNRTRSGDDGRGAHAELEQDEEECDEPRKESNGAVEDADERIFSPPFRVLGTKPLRRDGAAHHAFDRTVCESLREEGGEDDTGDGRRMAHHLVFGDLFGERNDLLTNRLYLHGCVSS